MSVKFKRGERVRHVDGFNRDATVLWSRPDIDGVRRYRLDVPRSEHLGGRTKVWIREDRLLRETDD